MPWIKRRQDEHVCRKPELDVSPKPFPGDIWECDDTNCHLQWRVHEHQLDGLYWMPFIRCDQHGDDLCPEVLR